MPKSKRNKIVALTETAPKGKENKAKLIEKIRDSLENTKSCYVFEIYNMRVSAMKDVRHKLNSSRFFMGKNKVMQVALGRTKEDEHQPNSHKISELLVGTCGLLFTDESEETVVKFFNEYQEADYARAGFRATETVTLPEGPTELFTHAQEPFVRAQLGVPSSLRKGVVHIDRDFIVCNEGDVLTPEQARLLKLMDIKMNNFHLNLICQWSDGKFKTFAKSV